MRVIKAALVASITTAFVLVGPACANKKEEPKKEAKDANKDKAAKKKDEGKK